MRNVWTYTAPRSATRGIEMRWGRPRHTARLYRNLPGHATHVLACAMVNDRPLSRGRPFIDRKLRPELDARPAPPTLPTAPPQAELRRRVRQMLGPRLCERLGVPTTDARRVAPHRVFTLNPDVISVEIDGDSVLLDLRTARSFSLNPAGSLLWNRLRAGRPLGAAHAALRRRFDVPAEVAWADLAALVSDLRREGLLREAAPKAPRPGPRPGGAFGRGAASRGGAAISSGGKAARANRQSARSNSAPSLFALHAVGLVKDGCGFLIAAASAWHKSPACRALIRAGYRSLSGNTPLLREAGAGLELAPVARTAPGAQIPMARIGKSAPRPAAKRQAAAEPCRPLFLLFPQAVDWPDSSLEPLGRSRALEELLPLTLVMRERDLEPREFELLARLVQTTACYRLHCGEDVSALPALFDGLLNQWKASQKETKKTKKRKRPERTPRP